MDQTYMKEQPVLKLIVSMALPMVISMMVSSLYNIVDSFFIARISEDAMTALSLVYPVQNLINAVMIGFGIGINAVISFYLGAQDKKMADRAATQGMLLGTIHGVGFMILGIAVMRPFLQMFTGNAQIVDYGVRYSRIAFLFATALSWQLVFEKTFQAVGRMDGGIDNSKIMFLNNAVSRSDPEVRKKQLERNQAILYHGDTLAYIKVR